MKENTGMKRKTGFTLIEVAVSAIVMGVIAIAYASFFRAADSQRTAQEQLVIAMEIASRQIEFLRTADETATAGINAPPFSTAGTFAQTFRQVPVPFTDPGGAIGMPSLATGVGSSPAQFLIDANSYKFTSDATGHWLTGDGTLANTPPELVLPVELRPAGKFYTVQVHCARVRSFIGAILATDEQNAESLLIKYQVEVFVGGTPPGQPAPNGRCVLVVPYLKEVHT